MNEGVFYNSSFVLVLYLPADEGGEYAAGAGGGGLGVPDGAAVRAAQIYGQIAGDHPMGKFMWGNTKFLSPEGMSDSEMHRR